MRGNKISVSLLVFFSISICSSAYAAVPTQFIAKMYTEALGRAPDPSGWQSSVNYFTSSGCNQNTLSSYGQSIFSSAEYSNLGYGAPPKVLTLYRAILNREPEVGGYNYWVQVLRNGTPLTKVVSAFFNSPEFAGMVPAICKGTSYSFRGPLAMQIDATGPGYGNLTEDQLQSLLNSTPFGGTVYLQQKTVVYLTQPLVIPAGVTLATYGYPDPNHHARMARLVRASSFADEMVSIYSGSLRNIWVDGQRTGYSTGVLRAINIAIYGGNGVLVDSNFISNSLGWTSLVAFGSRRGLPCSSNIITNNVVTSYSALHYSSSAGYASYTDGLSIACENAIVNNNSIIDPTDVGIVLFSSTPAVQHSQVGGNTIVSAGNSAFGGIVLDTGHITSTNNKSPDFTGAVINYNKLWNGPNTHFVIGLSVGDCAWNAEGTELIGYGASVYGNWTVGITSNFGEAIVVSCMTSAYVQNNVFNATLIPQSWTYCPTGYVLASVSAGLASGDIQSYADTKVLGCISDNSPSDGY